MAEQLRLLAVHAHPDDEAVSTGGALALYAARGARTILVTCTRGEEGEIVDDALKAEIADSAPSPDVAQARLAAVRDRELAAAVQALHISQFYQLGYRDSGMAGTGANQNPLAFTNANLAEATTRLVEIVRRERPHVIISYNEVGGYGHPDHIMAHRIAMLAYDGAAAVDVYPQQSAETPPWQPLKFYYTANSRDRMARMAERAAELGVELNWGSAVAKQRPALLRGEPVDPENPARPPWGAPEDAITTFIDIRAALDAKRASLAAHRTQAVSTNRFFANMPDDFATEAYGTEYFILVRSRVSTVRPEDDLFTGIAQG
jgi:N-acetyl-1-D-myo-inositol-2-amino-2-deoxy-alpha-D-glucopyranoside deacetylase